LVAQKKGVFNAVLVAAPCHGIVHVMRFVVREGAPFETLPLLLRQFCRDCQAKGFIGMFVFLDPKRDQERAILSMLERMKCVRVADCHVAVAANFSTLLRW